MDSKEHISISFHLGTGTPASFKVDLDRCFRWVTGFTVGFLLCFLGTLFFFREMRQSRFLRNEIFALKQQGQIPSLVDADLDRAPVSLPSVSAAPASIPDPSIASAKISDIVIDSDDTYTQARVVLTTTHPGQVKGSLLMVLETEMPRIGTGNPQTFGKHRYITYPGYRHHDEFKEQSIHQLERKPFSFSKGLQATAEFSLPNLVRPVAMHVYIFDEAGNIQRHERKAISSGQEVP